MAKITKKTKQKKPRITALRRKVAEIYDFFAATYIKHADREYYDQPFTLEPWQWKDIWLPIFGTNTKGKRWYNKALIGLPRITGKSELAARIVLTVFMMEPLPEGEYGVVASSKEQARIVFKKIAAMIRLSPQLSARFDILKNEIVDRETGATIKTFPAEEAALQGIHLICAVLDEAHVWKSTAVYTSVLSGMKGQPNALLVIITTAGERKAGPLWDTVIPTLMKDEHAYIHWAAAQSLDDQLANKPCNYRDERIWRRVCFASWHSMDDIRDQYNSLPFSEFIRYVLNVFPPDALAVDRFFKPRQVKACLACPDDVFDWLSTLALGIDGAVNGDSFGLCFASDGGGGFVDLWPVIFADPTMEGRYDLTQIEELVLEYYEEYQLDRIGIDPARLVMFAQHLINRYGIPIEEFVQSHKNMAAVSAYLEELIIEGRLRIHGPDADLLVEHFINCTRESAMQYGYRMGKTGSREEKNDGAIAAGIAAIILDQSSGASRSVVAEV